jgi:hypothetical protein
MIGQLNPGRVFPIFANRANQSHIYYGRHWSAIALRCRANLAMPFQFRLDSFPGSSPNILAVNAADETVTQSVLGAAVQGLANGKAYLSFAGLNSGALAPGFWFYKITIGAATYWSDVFETVDHECVDQWTELVFWHEKDKGETLYQTGWKQIFGMVNAAWAAPEIIREIDAVENANGVEFLNFAQTKGRIAFEAAPFPDSALPALAMIGEHSNVQLRFLPGSRIDTIQKVQFEARAAGPFAHVGKFTAETMHDAFTGCEENFVLA